MQKKLDETLNSLLNSFRKKFHKVRTRQELEDLKIEYLGRKKGLLNQITGAIPNLPEKERVGIGTKVKQAHLEIEEAIKARAQELSEPRTKRKVDITTPGKKESIGHSHPITQVIEEVKEIFHYLGFGWVDGPEVDSDDYNFQKLNIPAYHPARDVQQTYYIDSNTLLRTHTSNMQVRYMEKNKPPIRMLFPGRVYRRDMPDATHLPSFYQIEGLLVDKTTSLTELLGCLDFFAKSFFGEKSKIRVYGHHFPYTEPSIEVEVLHPEKGWIEILGAGMVHPNVLKNGKINPQVYRGWAFGMGPDRLAMLKYDISDIRTLYTNDIRVLDQF